MQTVQDSSHWKGLVTRLYYRIAGIGYLNLDSKTYYVFRFT
jgi:hypothetical protein